MTLIPEAIRARFHRPKCPGCTFPVHFFEGEPGHVVRCVADRAVWIGYGPVGMAPVVPRRLEMRR